MAAYYDQIPTGPERAVWPDIVYVRVRPDWGRHSDYRPGSAGVQEIPLAEPRSSGATREAVGTSRGGNELSP